METPIQAPRTQPRPGSAPPEAAPSAAADRQSGGESLALWNMPLRQLAHETAQVNHLLQQAAATLRANATNPHYFYEIGTRLKQQGRLEPAVQHFRRTLQLAPGHLGAWIGLVEVLVTQARWPEAEQAVAEALEYHDANPRLRFLAARCCAQCGRWPAAAGHLQIALAGDPQQWQLWLLLADALRRQGRMPEAMQALEQVCRLHPFDASSQWGQAMLHLQQQAWSSGWSSWNWRPSRIRRAHQPPSPWPYWQGEPLADKTLLVRCEPRRSWNLLLASCLPSLRGKVGTVLLETPAELQPLWRRSFPWAELVPAGAFPPGKAPKDGLPRPDAECYLGDLPGRVRCSGEAFPQRNVFLRADTDRVQHYRRLLEEQGRMSVGLLWRPSSYRQDRFGRSLSLEECEPLLRMRQFRWVPLVAPSTYERRLWERFTGETPLLLPEATEGRRCLDEMAALLSALDLVIGVPTYHMHLAGGLGLSAWVLLAHWPSWMWPLEGETTPWYPSLRLFRQGFQQDWTEAVAHVAQALRQMAAVCETTSCR